MPFTTYAELQTAVLSRLDRADLTTEVVDWISLAENEIYRWLRVYWVEARSFATPTTSFVALPGGSGVPEFNEVRNLQWDYQNYRISLQQVTPDTIDRLVPYNTQGIPKYFCVHDEQFEIRPDPGGDNTSTLEVSYYFRPDALSDSNTSNELLVNAPDLLFNRTVAEGWAHIFDEQREGKYLTRYQALKDDLMRQSKKSQWGGNTPQIRAETFNRIW